MRQAWRVALRLILASGLLVALAATVSTAPAPAPQLDFLSFAANLPPPVDRIEIRQAIAHAIDRRAVSGALSGTTPAAGINHPKLPGYNRQVRDYAFDPAKAKALVGQVGWDPNSVLRIYVSTGRAGPSWAGVREQVVAHITAVGITAQFVAMSFDALTRLITSGGGAMYLIGWASARSDFGYPYFSLGIAYDWKFKEGADALIQRFQQAGDAPVRERIAQELEQLLLDRALIIPLVFRG